MKHLRLSSLALGCPRARGRLLLARLAAGQAVTGYPDQWLALVRPGRLAATGRVALPTGSDHPSVRQIEAWLSLLVVGLAVVLAGAVAVGLA